MSPESTNPTKTCPDCGTRLSENATRCLVCGANIAPASPAKPAKPIQGPRMPEITLSLPVFLGMLLLLILIGAAVVLLVPGIANSFLKPAGMEVVNVTATPTPTITATATTTPTITASPLPTATATPLPPIQYTIQAGDSCAAIAGLFDVSVNTIVLTNNLDAACSLTPGKILLIPQPTPTPAPLATSTLSAGQATDTACQKVNHEVLSGQTLSGISLTYNVPAESIRDYNGLSGDTVRLGQILIIPLCERRPTAGPTPTATTPPPYGSPNLLLPADGAVFTKPDDAVTLQWSAVDTLRPNEAYAVTVFDVTDGGTRIAVEYVTETRLVLSADLRPFDTTPHILRWSVLTVRQTGTTTAGDPIWSPAGSVSTFRDFIWWSSTP
jgi:LysM repeat protein